MNNAKTARYDMEDSGIKSKFKSSMTSLINTPRHCLLQTRLVSVVILVCFILARSVTANIEVRFDNNHIKTRRGQNVELKCTATLTGKNRRPFVYWDRIDKESEKCVSLKAPDCSHISSSSEQGATKWKEVNCKVTTKILCNKSAQTKFLITTENEDRNIRKTILKITSIRKVDFAWKYACKAWSGPEYGEANATVTMDGPPLPSTTKPVHSSSSSNSSSNTTSPPGGGSVRAAGADNGVVVAIASALLVAIINVV